jgi:hypothetical protein
MAAKPTQHTAKQIPSAALYTRNGLILQSVHLFAGRGGGQQVLVISRLFDGWGNAPQM